MSQPVHGDPFLFFKDARSKFQPDTSCKLIAEKRSQHTLTEILSQLPPGLQRVSLGGWYSRSTWPSRTLSADAQVDVSPGRTGQADG